MRSNLHGLTVSLVVAACTLGCNTNGSGLSTGGGLGDGSGGSGGTPVPVGGSGGGQVGGAPGLGGSTVQRTGPMPPCALPMCGPGYVVSYTPCSCGVCVPASDASAGGDENLATGGAAGSKGAGGSGGSTAGSSGSAGSGGKKTGGTTGSAGSGGTAETGGVSGTGGSTVICAGGGCVARVCADGSNPQASDTCDCSSSPCGCPCGCWNCPEDHPDAGAKKDAKSSDGPIICPAIACVVPKCLYGTQPSPEPCGCPICGPAPDAAAKKDVGLVDGPPAACPMLASLNPTDAAQVGYSAGRELLQCSYSGGTIEDCISSDATACPGPVLVGGDLIGCSNLCTASEYGLSYGGVGPSAVAPSINLPVGCKNRLQTPGGVAFYCCPCGS